MLKELCKKYRVADAPVRFIYINVLVYVFVVLIGAFSTLFNAGDVVDGMVSLFALPSSFPQLAMRPWTLFTYMFLHKDFSHILWNMLALFFFGRVFLNFYSVRHFVGMYLLGGFLGGVAFVLSYNLFPYFAPVVSMGTLEGASASVLAIIVASAVRSPEYRVNMFLFGSVKLSTLAFVMVAISLLMLPMGNAGGNIAHVGGAFSGWLMAYMLGKGVDLTVVINKPLDWITTLFGKGKVKSRGKKAKFTYSAGARSSDYEYNAHQKENEAEIDRILEKIKKGGYASLSDEEKKRLFDASSK